MRQIPLVGNKEELKMRIRIRISLFCILCLLLGACSNEDMIPSTSEGGEECAFQFLLRVPGTIDVETKAGTETTILKLGDTNIYNVWILQFKKDGTELLKAVFADRNSITAVPGSGSTDYNQLLIQLTKDDMRFKNETSEFYIIVNAEEMNATEATASLFGNDGTSGIPKTLSVTDLMAKTKNITYSSDGAPTGTNILSSGPTDYTKDPASSETDMKLVVLSRMYRAFAKVTVTVNSSVTSGNFKLIDTKPVIMSNVPKVTRLYDDDSIYPMISSPLSTNFYTEEIAVSGISLGEKEGVFYMAENIRGTGSATTAQEKNKKDKGPGTGGSLDGCTYLLVKGQYQYPLGGGAYSSPIDVEYKFYLGGDLVTDYNIYRDYHYKLTVNIAGPNSADLRVTITNGNVAVFDDVDNVENTVNFGEEK